jgi:hypothetical protein
VGLEVGHELVDTGGQQGDLNFGATGVTGLTCVVFDNGSFDTGCNHFFFL